MIYVNARFRRQRITGVQRYASEILARIGDSVQELIPDRWSEGMKGHAWEQVVLPARAADGLLWNPCATGPIAHSRFVVTVHDLAFLDHPEWFSRSFGGLYRLVVPQLIRRARRVIADSEYTKGRILHWTGVPEEKVVTIPLAPWMRQADAHPDAAQKTLARLGLLGKRFVLSACSLEPRKNLGKLLEAWHAILPELPPDAVLVVAGGTAPRVFALQGKATLASDRVLYVGYVPDEELEQLFDHAEAFVYPSLYEGFGLPPLEAMVRGCPVLASQATSIPEVTGDAALLFEPTDAFEIGRQLLLVLSNPDLRHHLSEAGRARAGIFSWDGTAQRTLATLQAEAN